MSGLPDGGRRQGQAQRHRGSLTNFCSVTAGSNSEGAIDPLGQVMANEYANALIDAGDVPAIADIET